MLTAMARRAPRNARWSLGSRQSWTPRPSTSASVIVPLGAARRDARKIDARARGRAPARQVRRDIAAAAVRPLAARRRRLGKFADHRAGFGMRTFLELEQRRTDLDPLARLGQKLGDMPAFGDGISTTAFSVSTDTSGWSTTT